MSDSSRSSSAVAMSTGARGGIGSEVVARLRAAGHRVQVIAVDGGFTTVRPLVK